MNPTSSIAIIAGVISGVLAIGVLLILAYVAVKYSNKGKLVKFVSMKRIMFKNNLFIFQTLKR